MRIEAEALPPFLLKGVDAEWPVAAAATADHAADWLRLSLVSTETPRPNPQGKRRKSKRRIVALPDQALSTVAGKGSLKVSVPLDVAEPAIDFVVKADVVSNPYSNRVLGNELLQTVPDARAGPGRSADGCRQPRASSRAKPGKLRGKLIRHPAFKQNVNVAVCGLARRLRGPTADGPRRQDRFRDSRSPSPRNRPRGPLPNVSITVSLADGKVPVTQPLELKVRPRSPPRASSGTAKK